MTTSQSYARPIRVLAVLVAVTSAMWEATAFGPVSRAPALVAVRVAETLVALGIALLSHPRRSIRFLQALAYALALDVVAANVGVMVITPEAVWEVAAIVTAVILGAALFAPWPWRWQAVLAGSICVTTVGALVLAVPRDVVPAAWIPRLAIIYVTIGAVSVLGSYLKDKDRAQMAESEARYRGLFQAAGDAIAVLDAAGVIREGNPQLAALLGRPPAEVVGRPLSDFYARTPPDGAETGVPAEHRAALGGEIRTGPRTLARPDGRTIEVNATFARADTPQGPIVQAILHDLTEQRALERRRIQEQRLDALARLAGALAHQFNNLLGGILTHVEVLREEAAGAPAQALDEIAAAARRGRELTTELLRFTRHGVVTLRPTDAGGVVRGAAALARTVLPAAVAVEATAPADLPPIAADPDHLAHACLQLLLNARDAMRGRQGGRLTITAAPERLTTPEPRWPGAQPGRYVRISVGDSGAGMDAATLERVFEPFFSTKPMHQAIGLGLAGVYAVARNHHGSVRIESEKGRGTSVHLLLPVAEDLGLAGAAAPAPPRPAAAATAGATILVVDDEEIVRNSVRRALTRWGYTVLEAHDAGTALAALQRADPPVRLVILDLVLPGGGAGIFELLTSVQPGLRVLVSSGYTPDTEAARGLAERAHGFLQKPYDLSELRKAVEGALTQAA